MIENNPNSFRSSDEVINGLTEEYGNQPFLVFSRFNLARGHKDSRDLLFVSPETGRRDRYLIVEGQDDKDIYDELNRAGITQFPRNEIFENLVIYSLPEPVKPLVEERIFEGHPSSETYKSDNEIFLELGDLWARIHKITGLVPKDEPLSQTGMLDFQDEEKSLLPIPPYTRLIPINDRRMATDHFLNSLRNQLLHINPRRQYSVLIEAASLGWQDQNE